MHFPTTKKIDTSEPNPVDYFCIVHDRFMATSSTSRMSETGRVPPTDEWFQGSVSYADRIKRWPDKRGRCAGTFCEQSLTRDDLDLSAQPDICAVATTGRAVTVVIRRSSAESV